MFKKCEWIIKAALYLTFFVPLVVMPTSFIFPFVVPKVLLLRSLVTIMVGCYVLLLIGDWQKYKIRWTPLTIAVSSFIASFALSTAFGVDSYHSFWDNHERMLGLFTILHYYAIYLIATAVLRDWDDWKWALRIFLFAGTIVMFIAMIQVFNPSFLLNQGSVRVISTLGNAIYVGGYGLFLITIATVLFLREKDVLWRVASVVMGLFGLYGMLESGTRGSLGGLGVGIMVALFMYAFTLKNAARLRKALLIIAAVIVVAVVTLHFNRQSSFVTSTPALDRVFNTTLSSVLNSSRAIAWQVAFTSWEQRPILGWGPNNFFYAFNTNYNPRSLEFGYGETWFDNAHNIIVNTLAVQGVIGLLTYLSIFVVGIWALWKAYREKNLNLHIVVIGCAFLVAHLAENITVFENVTSYLYFVVWLAALNALIMNDANKKTPAVAKANTAPAANSIRSVGTGHAVIAGGAVLLIIFICNIQPARANMNTLTTLMKIGSDVVGAVPTMQDAFSFSSPHIDDIRSDISRAAVQAVEAQYQQLGADKSNQVLAVVQTAIQQNAALHPLDIRNQLLLAEINQTAATINSNVNDLLQAETYLKQAQTYSPRRQQISYALASIELELGKTTDAVSLLGQTIKDDPNIAEGYWRLAYIYKVIGDTSSSEAVLALAVKNGVVFGDQDNAIIAQIRAMGTTTPSTTKK